MDQYERGGDTRPRERGDAPAEAGGERSVRTESAVPPAEAFAALGNETRVEILRALADAGEPATFSELFERTEIEDSANFNYHLQRLTGHFLANTEAGYEFRHPGRKVVSAIFSGTLTERAQLGFFPAEGSCHDCGGDLHAWYVDGDLSVGCTACGALLASYPFPSGGIDGRPGDELLDAFGHYVRHHYCLSADGVCPECAGHIATELLAEPACEGRSVAVEHVCERCDYRLESTVGVSLLDSIEVLTFHAERGVDVSSQPFWRFPWCVEDDYTDIVSEDPLRVRVTIPCDGDELRVTVGADATVLDTETQ